MADSSLQFCMVIRDGACGVADWWTGRLLSQAKDFKYLVILFVSDGKMEHEMDRWIGASSAVMQVLFQTVMVKWKLRLKVKLFI